MIRILILYIQALDNLPVTGITLVGTEQAMIYTCIKGEERLVEMKCLKYLVLYRVVSLFEDGTIISNDRFAIWLKTVGIPFNLYGIISSGFISMKKLLAANTLLSLYLFSSYVSACELLKADDSDFPESVAQSQSDTGIATAWYDGGTGRYRHGVLGDAIEPSILRVTSDAGCTYSVELGRPHVFEDIQTRLADIDQKPGDEVITIRSHQNYGAQIAIYQLGEGGLELFTETPYIGTSNRWLAPVGIADFNNDGDMDIAFVDRPHLATTLRVWTYRDGKMQEIVSRGGYSNHRIGEDFISGGIKTCEGKTIMITADSGWRRILASTLENDLLNTTDIGPFDGAESFQKALQCN